MKILLLLTASLAVSLFPADADTFRLKGGRLVEGKVAMETADTYILLVEIQKGIRDEITVKKSNIVSVTKEDQSLKAFDKIPELLPTDDLLTEKDYQVLIDKKLTPFLEKYPNSKYAAKVREVEEALLDELFLVQSGALKINGKWLTAEDHKANKYEIEAILALNPVFVNAKKHNYGAALITLAEQEKAYKNTKAYHDALDMCLSFLPTYKYRAQTVVDNAPELIRKRDLSLNRLPSSDRNRVDRILAAEEAKYQSQLYKAKQSGGKWLPLNRFHPESAEAVVKSISTESSRLQKLAAEEYTDAGALYRDFLISIDTNDLDLAKDQLNQFSRTRAPKDYSDALRDKYADAVAQMKLIEKQKKAEAEEEERKVKEDAKNKTEEKPEKKAQ